MKKFFYSVLLLAVAGMTSPIFVSCDEENESEKIVANDKYLCFKYWASNDVLYLADVNTTGIGSLSFTAPATYQGIEGKESNLVEFSGKQADDATFSVKLVLKSNWKELLAQKESVELYNAYGTGSTKGQGTLSLGLNMKGGTYSKARLGDKYEETVSAYIEKLGIDY